MNKFVSAKSILKFVRCVILNCSFVGSTQSILTTFPQKVLKDVHCFQYIKRNLTIGSNGKKQPLLDCRQVQIGEYEMKNGRGKEIVRSHVTI